MRVALTADVHGRWEDAAGFARRYSCEAILVAGDLGEAAYSVDWPIPLYWVWGDDDSRLVWRHLTSAGQVQHCHLIPNWTTVTIGGLTVLGVGAERDNAALPGPAVVLPPPSPVPRADLVLSHAAGWHRRVTSGSKTYDVFDAQVSRAVRDSGARIAVSGHNHRWLAGRTCGGRTRCYGLGNRPADWAVLDTATLRVSRPSSLA
jgi:hypothetical protein